MSQSSYVIANLAQWMSSPSRSAGRGKTQSSPSLPANTIQKTNSASVVVLLITGGDLH